MGTTPGGTSTNVGATDILNRYLGSIHSTTVSGLPTSGTLYVTYLTRDTPGSPSIYRYVRHQYTMNVPQSFTLTVTKKGTGSGIVTGGGVGV